MTGSDKQGAPGDSLIKGETALLGICALVLFTAAATRWPYAFYVLLRLLICMASAFAATKRHAEGNLLWVWVFGAIAVLFNPLLPVRMSRSDWEIVNVLTGAFFVVWVIYSLIVPKKLDLS